MDYNDEHADILGGPILQNPNTCFLRQWSQYSIFFRTSLILGLGLTILFLSVRAWHIWKKNRELGYRKAMRRKHGIPDSDCRPFAVAYAAATRARAEIEVRERQKTIKVTKDRPAMDHRITFSDVHGLRRRVAEPAAKPHIYQLPATRRTTSGYDPKPNGFDFAQRYNPRLRDGVLPVSGVPLSQGKKSVHRRASRKDLIFNLNEAVEGKKRAFDHENNLEPETSKKSRVDSEDLIDADEEPAWHDEEDEIQPSQQRSKRMFDSDEEGDYMRTDGRDKRPRNMSRGQTPEDQDMEDVYDDDVADLHPLVRGKKRDRAEAGSTFGGDDGEEALDDQDDKVHRHRKRRTVQSRKLDISPRGSKRDRDSEFPESESGIAVSHVHREPTLKKKKRGKKEKASSSEAGSDPTDGSQDPLCKGRKIGEEWESNGVQFKVGNEGERLRLTLVKKARNKYSMPRDSQHPDRQANMEIYVEIWLTEEQYKVSEERRELVWQETPRASTEPSTPSEASGSPAKMGKDLLWDSMKNSPVSRRAFRQSLTNGSARVNPFQQPLPQTTAGRRVASSNIHPPPLIPGVAEGPSRPGFRAFSKWEKQDLEAEAMARMRARMLEQKQIENPLAKTSELSTSATAPELWPKPLTVPIITFTSPSPVTSTSSAPLCSETKPAISTTSTSMDASKTPTTFASTTTIPPAASAPGNNKLRLFATSAPQPAPVAPTFSVGPPISQPPTTTVAPITTSSSSRSPVPNFFAKPAAPSPSAPSAAPLFSFGPTPAVTAPSTARSFSFGPTSLQPQAAPTTSSAFAAPAASSTETNKPMPFTFAKPSAPPFSASISTSAQPNSPSTFDTPESTNALSAPSAPAPLKFDFSRKAASTTPKPVAASPITFAASAVDAPKPAGSSFSFSVATAQGSPLGTNTPPNFSYSQPQSTSVFSNTTAASKPVATSEAPKVEALENKTQKVLFGQPSGGSVFGPTGTSSASKPTFNFAAPSVTSAFAAAAAAGNAKADSSVSIFAATNAVKEDANKSVTPAPASVFGSRSFSANGASDNIFGSSARVQSGDANTSTSVPKSAFSSSISSNSFSTTPIGSPAGFGSTQSNTFSFGNGSVKPANSSNPLPFSASPSDTAVFSFDKKDDAAAPSSSTGTSTGSASSTPTFAFGMSGFSQGQAPAATSNASSQPQSVFGKPSVPAPSAFGFGSGSGNGGNTFTFGGQPGGQNQLQ